MRQARIKAEEGQSGVYHCLSRIVGGQCLLDDVGKEKLVSLLHQLARFCEVEILTYCILSNHFHLLIRIPAQLPPESYSDADLCRKLEDFHGPRANLTLQAAQCLEQGRPLDADLRKAVLSRLRDVSVFLQEFKQRFTRWYNRLHQRTGYLWGERFKSVLVEDAPLALRAMAAYIDLNPVRAGLVRDPKDYRFCGYTAALAGEASLRSGLSSFLEASEWPEAAAEYRRLLFVTGGRSGHSDKQALDPKSIQSALQQGGELPLGQILRLHIRHFTDGVFLGSRQYVDEMWARHRQRFSQRRRSGARTIRGAPLPGLAVLRDLRVDAVRASANLLPSGD
ncbi:MAG: transposase [Verrucomicrobiota bacterium]